MVSKFASEFTSKSTNMSKNTRSKTTLNEEKRKDPNVGIFTNTSGRVYETLHLEWSRIYSMFDNGDFSAITHDQPAYAKIINSQLHCIMERPPLMSHTEPVRWELDHAIPKE